MEAKQTPTAEHILVCLSPSPSNRKIIRTAARMAEAFRGKITALYIETPHNMHMEDDEKAKLESNMHLAKELGAVIETVYGEDVAYQIAEFARLSGITKIVIGRSAVLKHKLFHKPSLTDQLIRYAPSMDIYVIPDGENHSLLHMERTQHRELHAIFSPLDIFKCIMVLAFCTLIGMIFESCGLTEANIIAVYVLGVLITAVITRHQAYSVVASFASVLVFNFFFTIPKYTLAAIGAEYPVTFIIMFLVAVISSSLAVRLKKIARQAAQAAYRTKVLFDTNQLLQQANGTAAIISATASQLMKLLEKNLVIYLTKEQTLGKPQFFALPNTSYDDSYMSFEEQQVAHWVLENNQQAGATTRQMPDAKCRYLAIRTSNNIYGVIGIVMNHEPLDAFENSILLSILGECALAMENEKNAREKEEAAVLAKNEQLRANLLRAISHDLRTPLTSISGNASNLMSNWKNFTEETAVSMATSIYEDSMWLINLVENLLSVTRLGEGQVNLHRSTELLEDIIEESMRHLNRKSIEHHLSVKLPDDILLVKVDSKLIVQLFINLLDNAIKYTQPGSHIEVAAHQDGNFVVTTISDDGPGIRDEQKARIFEMFYSGANQIADSRRSMGLGLSLCKSIVTAHGGSIIVTDNQPSGTIFTFTLPTGEVQLHE